MPLKIRQIYKYIVLKERKCKKIKTALIVKKTKKDGFTLGNLHT